MLKIRVSSVRLHWLPFLCAKSFHLWVTRWRLSTVRMNWYLMVSLFALLSPMSTCWPSGHLLGASYNVNDSFCIPWHWRCHFIPCLGHQPQGHCECCQWDYSCWINAGGCRDDSASVLSLVTSDSVPSQEPGAVWLRILIIAENATIHNRKLLGATRRQ